MNFKSCFNTKTLLFAVLIAFIIFAVTSMKDIALLVFFSYVISSAINPFIEKLSQKMPRTLATVIMLTIITLVIIGLLVPIIIMSVNEIKDLINSAPEHIDSFTNFLTTHKFNGKTITELVNLDSFLTNSTMIAREVIGKSINVTMGFLGIITVLVTMGIIVFFLSNDRKVIKDYSLNLFPSAIRSRASEVIDELEVKVGGYVTAQLICITVVGLIVTLGLILLKVDYAVLLGLISAVLDLVPIVGPTVAGLLILFTASSKSVVIAVLSVIVMLFAQFVENNWAKPYFFSKYMDLHPLVVIFSFIIAAKFLGVIGVIVAPAIAAVIITLFDELYIKTMNAEETPATSIEGQKDNG